MLVVSGQLPNDPLYAGYSTASRMYIHFRLLELYEPITETRNRKRLEENDLSNWELRVEKYRVFYDVVIEGDNGTVQIKAVGYKEHNTLYIGGRDLKGRNVG